MIAYHGSPLSGTSVDEAKFFAGRHALVSFAHPGSLPTIAEVCSSFILDNGAYTMWRQGIQVDWEDYIHWIAKWSHHPRCDFWFLPDVIDGDEEANWRLIEAYRHVEPYGVPVYHMHETMSHLDRLMRNFSRIAIGGSHFYPTIGSDLWWNRIKEVMRVMCDSQGNPRVKIHGLKMLNPDIFSRLPLSSADSATVARHCHGTERSRWGYYLPPNSAVRAEVIASRIESVNSANIWRPVMSQADIFGFLDEFEDRGEEDVIRAA